MPYKKIKNEIIIKVFRDGFFIEKQGDMPIKTEINKNKKDLILRFLEKEVLTFLSFKLFIFFIFPNVLKI